MVIHLYLCKKELVKIKNHLFYINLELCPTNTKEAGTHLIKDLKLSPFQLFLRKYKIDEIPQLINVFIGDMSFVGPRPCLPNQYYLIKERKKKGIFKVKPGITGLAQIKNITMAHPTKLSKIELKMINNMNLINYFNGPFLFSRFEL
jgi:O-antigen biosynthesis protein WbqP